MEGAVAKEVIMTEKMEVVVGVGWMWRVGVGGGGWCWGWRRARCWSVLKEVMVTRMVKVSSSCTTEREGAANTRLHFLQHLEASLNKSPKMGSPCKPYCLNFYRGEWTVYSK